MSTNLTKGWFLFKINLMLNLLEVGMEQWQLMYLYLFKCNLNLLIDCRWIPVYTSGDKNLAVMSIAFLLKSKNDAVVWRGPKKNGKANPRILKIIIIPESEARTI